MKFLSVCSGIEAASVAWIPLGWEAIAISEIEKFPSQVVEHHWKTPNWGDMNDWKQWPDADFDVLVGGTPCQSFSVAGLRAGLEDPRGNLSLVYLAILDRYRPEWLVWENVPGVLSSEGGRDFGAIIGGMVELGYSPSWRVLNAQFFGVPQRRRRVFVVGHLGDWRRAAAVLFEPSSLRRDPPPSRTKGQGITRDVAHSLAAGGNLKHREDQDTLVEGKPSKWPAETACTLNAAYGTKQGLEDQHALGGASLFVPDHVGALTAKGPESLGAPEVDGNHYIVSSGQANATITKEIAPALDCLHEAPILASDDPSFVQDVADPLTANEQKTYTHEGKNNFRTRNVQAYAPGETAAPLTAGSNPNSNIAGRHREDDENLAVDPIAFAQNQRDEVRIMDQVGALAAEPGAKQQTYIATIQERAEAENPDVGPDGAGFKTDDLAYTLEARPRTQSVAIRTANTGANGHGIADDVAHTIDGAQGQAIAFKPGQSEAAGAFLPTTELSPTLQGTPNGSTATPAVAFKPSHFTRGKDGAPNDIVPPLSADADKGDQDPVVFETRLARNDRGAPADVVPPLKAQSGESGKGDAAPVLLDAMIVRRLTPTECERLQGFPDGYTDIPGASDSARYKALGNSMAVPVMRWIGERIMKVSES